MKVSENFVIQEFVSPDVYAQFGDKALWFVDDKVIKAAQLFKNLVSNIHGQNSVVINSSKLGYSGSGYREPLQYVKGQFKKNPLSQSLHRQGKAIDVKVNVKGQDRWLTSIEMYEIVMQNQEKFLLEGITAIETPSATIGKNIDWCHIDCRNSKEKEIIIVKP